jgi:transposase-like protein
LLAALRHFDPETARAYVASIKWPNGPVCPKCGSVNVGTIKGRGTFQCREKGCRKQFSLISGTIFEATHLRLDQWCAAVWMIVNCRNGVSSCEIARAVGCKQQSAWHLLHRIRHVVHEDHELTDKLVGIIESDSAFLGGLLKFMSPARKRRAKAKGRQYGNKSVVHALRERRSGTVRAGVVPGNQKDAIVDLIIKNVRRGSFLYTDASNVYDWARTPACSWRHADVDHSAEQYVKGPVHVNGCENFFNCLRRTVKGTYVHVDHEHLGAYVDEQVYRFNNRKDTDWERFDAAMRKIVGKRLMYKVLTDGATR